MTMIAFQCDREDKAFLDAINNQFHDAVIYQSHGLTGGETLFTVVIPLVCVTLEIATFVLDYIVLPRMNKKKTEDSDSVIDSRKVINEGTEIIFDESTEEAIVDKLSISLHIDIKK